MTFTELKVVGGILLVILVLSLINFRSAITKAHDVQRKNDLKHIRASLDDYLREVGFIPQSQEGKILACEPILSLDNEGREVFKFKPCIFAKDSLVDPRKTTRAFIDPLPQDPLASSKNYTYIYLSDGKNYHLLAHLDRRSDREYNMKVEKRGVVCGVKLCNFAVANSYDVPVDVNLEDIPPEE